jgi:hypothetical protein
VRLPLLILAGLVALPSMASAQSLTDTHERVWSPAGKTPAVHYRPLGKRACTAARSGAHPWHKGQAAAAPSCANSDSVATAAPKKAVVRPGA